VGSASPVRVRVISRLRRVAASSATYVPGCSTVSLETLASAVCCVAPA
jgi:hypothetical protein